MQNQPTSPLEIVAATDVGRARELNEDNARVVTQGAIDAAWNLAGVLIMADGMGGHQAGEVASGLAADAVEDFFAQPPAPQTSSESALDERALLEHFETAMREANAQVFAHAAPEKDGAAAARPGTTLTVCLLREAEYFIGHIGDSRAYLLRAASEESGEEFIAEQITDDDSFVAQAVLQGHMTLAEARTSPLRHQITKAVGLDVEVEPEMYQGSWQKGEVLLLCSDGLTEHVADEELAAVVLTATSLETACRELIALANERGGSDNISICLARHAVSTPIVESDVESDIEQLTLIAPEEINAPEIAEGESTESESTETENLETADSETTNSETAAEADSTKEVWDKADLKQVALPKDNLKNLTRQNEGLKSSADTSLREVRDSLTFSETRLLRRRQVRQRNNMIFIALLLLPVVLLAAFLWRKRAASVTVSPTVEISQRTATPDNGVFKVSVGPIKNGEALKIMCSSNALLKIETVGKTFTTTKISEQIVRLDFADAKLLDQLKQQKWTLTCAPLAKNSANQMPQSVWKKPAEVSPNNEYSLLGQSTEKQLDGAMTARPEEWARFRLTPAASTPASG